MSGLDDEIARQNRAAAADEHDGTLAAALGVRLIQDLFRVGPVPEPWRADVAEFLARVPAQRWQTGHVIETSTLGPRFRAEVPHLLPPLSGFGARRTRRRQLEEAGRRGRAVRFVAVPALTDHGDGFSDPGYLFEGGELVAWRFGTLVATHQAVRQLAASLRTQG